MHTISIILKVVLVVSFIVWMIARRKRIQAERDVMEEQRRKEDGEGMNMN